MGTEGFRGTLLSTLIVAPLMALAISLLYVSPSSAAPEGLTPRAPIYINGNAGFTHGNGVNGGGSGTENDPYIIENWDISAENVHGIWITSTTAHFVIRNCYVHDGSAKYKYGIYLEILINGIVDNNLVVNNWNGISIFSDNNLVLNNIVRKNIWAGIWLYYSNNNLVSNNIAENHDQSGIRLQYSDNNLVLNNIVENSLVGIRLSESSNNNLVLNNIVRKTSGMGIWLDYSNNNLVNNNIVENNNRYGFYSIESNNNLIYNNFINNTTQAYDIGANLWDNGYPSGGNYWSDYVGADNYRGENQDQPGSDGIGDTPYYIPRDNNLDRYPLVWTGSAVFRLENLYAVRLEKNLDLYQGSRLVVKFYTYWDAFENESVIENFVPPWHVEENEKVPHPTLPWCYKSAVKKARLDLTTDNTENVISTIASWTTRRSDLFGRISAIKGRWVFASPDEKDKLWKEIRDIRGWWLYAPT